MARQKNAKITEKMYVCTDLKTRNIIDSYIPSDGNTSDSNKITEMVKLFDLFIKAGIKGLTNKFTRAELDLLIEIFDDEDYSPILSPELFLKGIVSEYPCRKDKNLFLGLKNKIEGLDIIQCYILINKLFSGAEDIYMFADAFEKEKNIEASNIDIVNKTSETEDKNNNILLSENIPNEKSFLNEEQEINDTSSNTSHLITASGEHSNDEVNLEEVVATINNDGINNGEIIDDKKEKIMSDSEIVETKFEEISSEIISNVPIEQEFKKELKKTEITADPSNNIVNSTTENKPTFLAKKVRKFKITAFPKNTSNES